jgi:hypothetical protein
MGVHVKVAGAWQEIGEGGVSGVPWAKVTGGTVTEYTKGDGSVMEVHTFTANGTLTVDSPGYAEVLAVSGGGGSNGNGTIGGGGGRVHPGIVTLPAGALPVTVGAGGVNESGAGSTNCLGKPSSLGTVVVTGVGDAANDPIGGAGGTVATPAAGFTSSITGTALVYGRGGVAVGSIRANSGDGVAKYAGPAAAGVVVVAVQKLPPTVSGITATGGTESTYTGDGTNGVLGQTYKVHKFTAGGTLTVTQGGEVDVLLVGGGGGGGLGGGGGGQVMSVSGVMMPIGAQTVVVGAGGVANPNTAAFADSMGGESSVFGIVAIGGGLGGSGSNDTNSGRTASGGNGGCGGGAGSYRDSIGYPGVGLTYKGGSSHRYDYGTHWGGGGAGFSADGTNGAQDVAGNGGAGVASLITGTSVMLAGGGGGGHQGAGSDGGGVGGAGGGGNKSVAGTANTGGGGGAFAAGGSGLVVVRYKV